MAPRSDRPSPLHRAAYIALGLDWSYRAIDCMSEGLVAFLVGLDDDWAGLSPTMPLKRAAILMLDEVSVIVAASSTANTVRRKRLRPTRKDQPDRLRTRKPPRQRTACSRRVLVRDGPGGLIS
ncbi:MULTISPECIES: hypothetical protein [Actinoalloteichus]|uniref:Shikimate dehydrogenase substrate binding domain n=1 Tax=Actinoalloteichus fjordicus TaxID=1612552 RepID=A0AAC9LGV7_9PSEU|nr:MULTISPECIES: hypothetical protein [Actinoalloteichus]APU16532.1 Shikimate dehydrogenase substrate binding domain [Actinoalloteichus fjordicus]APU22600.1 Shikimate dehydrogenase substrate binding domain [Actinoalloteichus sp. GBA129-24]